MTMFDFRNGQLPDGFFWLNPPLEYRFEQGLVLHPKAQSDFWQTTHYGFRNDNGHCLLTEICGDFSLETRVSFHPQHQYDQCGLVVRIDSQNWIKCSTEYEDVMVSRLGSVVTNLGYSDWATQDVSSVVQTMSYRISRKGSDFLIEHSATGEHWQQMRIAHLHTAQEKVSAGIYACSPIDAGFHCKFEHIMLSENKWK
jgi:regulation of enolase protein 1 (concanavalin A-like superfamily)